MVEVSLEPYVAARCDERGADGDGSKDGEADAGKTVSANPPCIYVMQWHGVRGAVSRSLGIYAVWRWKSWRRG